MKRTEQIPYTMEVTQTMQKVCMMEEEFLREDIVEKSSSISRKSDAVLPIQAQETVGHLIRESAAEDSQIIETEVSWKPEQSPASEMTEHKQSKKEAHFEKKERKVVTSSVDGWPAEDVVSLVSETSLERQENMQNKKYTMKNISPRKKHVIPGSEMTVQREQEEHAHFQKSVHEIKRSQAEPSQISSEMTPIVKAKDITTKLVDVHEKGKSSAFFSVCLSWY